VMSISLSIAASSNTPQLLEHELRYESLFREGHGFSFPCDETGRVNLDALSDRARNNYLFARAMVGRDLAMPQVLTVAS
jgi:hypothetical protein